MARILVVDDAVSILQWMEQILTDAGYEVLTATGGKRVVQTLRQTPVDLVITDIYMPEQDGLEVIRDARRAAPGTRFIAMSSRPPETNLFVVAAALGAAATLQKPFGPELLLQTVSAVLQPNL